MKNLNQELRRIDGGGVTSAAGFQASGIVCGLKKSGNPDLALVCSETPCNFAGMFTSNLFPAAPVQLCRDRVAKCETVRAVVVNSGVANACTGAAGYQAAEETAAYTAGKLGIAQDDVLVGSTGRIGVQLPMEKIRAGIDMAVAALSADGSAVASEAIITTDTRPKRIAVSFDVNGKTVTLGGMTKGAGMIAPHMILAKPHATMLCYLTTDAAVSNSDLAVFLEEAVCGSFNRITVDNDMSTNDTCLIFANGVSGVKITAGGDSRENRLFREALAYITEYLATNMVMDGEGTTKIVEIRVEHARNEADAKICCKAIADSMLCKTAWFGCDPNWGRVLAAAGYSGAQFQPENVNLDYDGFPVVRAGMDAGTPEEVLAEALRKESFVLKLDLGAGDAQYHMWTGDISYEYVKINADYHT